MKEKIILAVVLYTITDETYYILNGPSRYADNYKANTLWEAFHLLKADGWEKCGKIRRSDNSLADMLVRKNEYAAIWKEQICDEAQDFLLEQIANTPIEPHNKKFQYKGQPAEKKQPVYQNSKKIYPRSRKVAFNALEHAEYKCEVDGEHPTFIRKKDNIPRCV